MNTPIEADKPKPPPMLTHAEVPGVEVYFLKVTPEVAKELLSLNTKGQRTITKGTVEKYASDMLTQDWFVNGDTIRISSDNELLDGQHRLSSIVESGEAQILLIVAGLDKASMLTIDAGRSRTYADTLKMEGITNHTLVASIIGRCLFWYRGNYGVRNTARRELNSYIGGNPSHAQRNSFRHALESKFEVTFSAAAKFGHNAYQRRKGISASTYGLAWIILTGIDRNRRNQGEESDLRELFFAEVLGTPKKTTDGYPIQTLHNRFMNMAGGRDSWDNVEQLDALFTVFNRWVKNEKLDRIYRPTYPIKASRLQMPFGFTEESF